MPSEQLLLGPRQSRQCDPDNNEADQENQQKHGDV
jgi:hypothetical protein